jgi:hypothetical protein
MKLAEKAAAAFNQPEPWTLIPKEQQTLSSRISDEKINSIILNTLTPIAKAQLTDFSIIREPITSTPFFSPANPSQALSKITIDLIIDYHDLNQVIQSINQNPNILWKELSYDSEKYPHNRAHLVFYFF